MQKKQENKKDLTKEYKYLDFNNPAAGQAARQRDEAMAKKQAADAAAKAAAKIAADKEAAQIAKERANIGIGFAPIKPSSDSPTQANQPSMQYSLLNKKKKRLEKTVLADTGFRNKSAPTEDSLSKKTLLGV